MLRCALWVSSALHDRGGPVADAAAKQRAWCRWEAGNNRNPSSGTAVNPHLETGLSYIVKSNSSNMRRSNAA